MTTRMLHLETDGPSALPQPSNMNQDEAKDVEDFEDEELLDGVIVRSNNWSGRRLGFLYRGLVATIVVALVIVMFVFIPWTTKGDNVRDVPKTGAMSAAGEQDSNNNSPLPTTAGTPSTMTLGCLPDRFDNEEMDLVDPIINFNKLYPGQFICSKPYKKTAADDGPDPQRYHFGVAADSGDVVWRDTITNETKVVFPNPSSSNNVYFSLRIDGTMVLNDNNSSSILWEAPPVNAKHPMSHTHRCLTTHDCPYFHIHSDGVLVVNWIAGDGQGWQAHSLFRVYDLE